MSKAQSKVYVHRGNDRRVNENTVQFPLLDSDFNIVRSERRKLVDRRKSNLKLIWQENQPIRQTEELNLVLNGKNFFFDSRLESFLLGRSPSCDMQLVSRFTSKRHATIKYQGGEFVLEDTSLNGTFIETEELGKLRVHGQRVYLYGEGKISLGSPIDRVDRDDLPLIYFHCQ